MPRTLLIFMQKFYKDTPLRDCDGSTSLSVYKERIDGILIQLWQTAQVTQSCQVHNYTECIEVEILPVPHKVNSTFFIALLLMVYFSRLFKPTSTALSSSLWAKVYSPQLLRIAFSVMNTQGISRTRE